jgi:hypothetical protein
MTPGNSRISALSDGLHRRRRVWLVALLLYGLAAGVDFAYHLIDDLRTRDEAIELSEIAVAFSAALFWPFDVVAMALLTNR